MIVLNKIVVTWSRRSIQTPIAHGWQLGGSDLLCWPTLLALLVVLYLIMNPINSAIIW